MDNPHYFNRSQRKSLRGQSQISDAEALPELTEEVERLLAKLQEQEVDVDQHTLQRVLEYARKA
jgi:chemotaxis protein histidine kinase CheA